MAALAAAAAEQQLRLSMRSIHLGASVVEQRRSVIVLICGTAGTGKSTLASLLGQRLGIATVLSTDSIRHMLRCAPSPRTTQTCRRHAPEAALRGGQQARLRHASIRTLPTWWRADHVRPPERRVIDPAQCLAVPRGFVDAETDPVLHASTYEAGAALAALPGDAAAAADMPARKRVTRGYKAQCAPVLQQLRQLIATWHRAGASAVVEGVHLRVQPVAHLAQRFPSVLPFLVRFRRSPRRRSRSVSPRGV